MNKFLSIFLKAINHGRLIPKQITRSDGKVETYWISPEDMNEGKNKGQKDLFSTEDAGAPNPADDRGYFDHLDRSADEYQVKPLVAKVAESDPELAKRLSTKYSNYHFDRDTKEKDIEIDYQIAWYMTLIKKHPESATEYRKEFHEKTDEPIKSINRRKVAMAKYKKGSQVAIKAGGTGSISWFSTRGYPMVRVSDGSERPMFFEELAI